MVAIGIGLGAGKFLTLLGSCRVVGTGGISGSGIDRLTGRGLRIAIAELIAHVRRAMIVFPARLTGRSVATTGARANEVPETAAFNALE